MTDEVAHFLTIGNLPEVNTAIKTGCDYIFAIGLLMLEWGLLPAVPSTALHELRRACPEALVIILIGSLADRQPAVLSVGADVFISKSELPERVAGHLLAAAAKIHT
jgi:hypothetical protein